MGNLHIYIVLSWVVIGAISMIILCYLDNKTEYTIGMALLGSLFGYFTVFMTIVFIVGDLFNFAKKRIFCITLIRFK